MSLSHIDNLFRRFRSLVRLLSSLPYHDYYDRHSMRMFDFHT